MGLTSQCVSCGQIGNVDWDTHLCDWCQGELDREELAVSNPYEEERYRSYCPECGDNTIWLRMVEENESWCETCGLFEDQAEERIKKGE